MLDARHESEVQGGVAGAGQLGEMEYDEEYLACHCRGFRGCGRGAGCRVADEGQG